jgi:hypothetical protein
MSNAPPIKPDIVTLHSLNGIRRSSTGVSTHTRNLRHRTGSPTGCHAAFVEGEDFDVLEKDFLGFGVGVPCGGCWDDLEKEER